MRFLPGPNELKKSQRPRSFRSTDTRTWHPEKRVCEVAAECGYGDANYFCRIFKEKVGMTPSQFRKRH